MAFSALVREVLVSCPGDVVDDAMVVAGAIQQWSVTYGKSFGTVVLPLSWREHAAAEFGRRPQASLNEQLVDRADAVIALIWHRLGSPTGEEESGTVEEVREAVKAGKDVALLVCDRPASPSEVDDDQLARRNDFLKSIQSECLYFTYSDETQLRRHVENALTRMVTRDQEHLASAVGTAGGAVEERSGAVIWPRVETREVASTDSRGRPKTSRTWRLVLENSGSAPAHNVKFALEPEEGDTSQRLPRVMDDGKPLEILAPGSTAEYPMSVYMGSASQCRCVVTWGDDEGPHSQAATIRFT